MKPKIDSTKFGSITIAGKVFEHDVLIRLDGKVKKRKKKLSKAIYGTSHVISLDEARYVYQEGAESLIIGAGQSGPLGLAEEAREWGYQLKPDYADKCHLCQEAREHLREKYPEHLVPEHHYIDHK